MPSPLGEGGPAGPDEGQVYHSSLLVGNDGKATPHPSAGKPADTFPQGGRLFCPCTLTPLPLCAIIPHESILFYYDLYRRVSVC